jgi:hypothetical protein
MLAECPTLERSQPVERHTDGPRYGVTLKALKMEAWLCMSEAPL